MKRIARAASYCQPRCGHARRRNPAFDSIRRHVSTTTARTAANDSSSKDNENEIASDKDGDSEASDYAHLASPMDDPEDAFSKMPLGGWDGRHLPKSMPAGWRERLAAFADDTDEDERNPRAARKREPTLHELQHQQILQMQDDEQKHAAQFDARLQQQLDQFKDRRFGSMGEEELRDGFWAEGDDPADEPTGDEEWNNDDIPSIAHAELEQHRELRQLARAAVWDMPLLWKHRQEFKPPTATQVLRFRYTTYMGEVHPAASKVVVDFNPASFPDLSPVQTSKLIKLLGVRYNPSTSRAKISCENFPTAAQNKRYLGDLVATLLAEARNPTDTFEDVPFDFRHHKPRGKLEFPEEWKMTADRRARLQETWSARDEAEARAAGTGRLVQGAALVKQLTASAEQRAREASESRARELEPVRVPAGRGGRRMRF